MYRQHPPEVELPTNKLSLRVTCWLCTDSIPLRLSCRLISLSEGDLLTMYSTDSIPLRLSCRLISLSEGDLLTMYRQHPPEVELPTNKLSLSVSCWLWTDSIYPEGELLTTQTASLKSRCRLFCILWGWAADYVQTAYPRVSCWLHRQHTLRVSCWLLTLLWGWAADYEQTASPSLRVSCWLWIDSIPRGWAVEQRLWRMTMHVCGNIICTVLRTLCMLWCTYLHPGLFSAGGQSREGFRKIKKCV